jgi:hypothetical protein
MQVLISINTYITLKISIVFLILKKPENLMIKKLKTNKNKTKIEPKANAKTALSML